MTATETRIELREARRDLFKALLFCLLAVVVVRSFLFEPFKIPSSSMVPTLHIGDHIFVSKFHYGLSIPFTKIELVSWSGPKRGEVIVFLFPRDESLHYIKRVVGLPGDKVVFKGRDLYVNGELIHKEKASQEVVQSVEQSVPGIKGDFFKENLFGREHLVRYTGSSEYNLEGLQSREEEVPANHYFVAGDNRDDSYDSRSWGFVPRENIKGRAEVIWLSLDSEQGWGLSKIRWNRCGTLVQ